MIIVDVTTFSVSSVYVLCGRWMRRQRVHCHIQFSATVHVKEQRVV